MTKLLTPEREAIRLAKNAYNREWRKKNPDKVKAAQERYWNKKAANSKKTTNSISIGNKSAVKAFSS